MDVKFDAKAAENLIQSMCVYCSAIQRDAKETMKLIDASGKWDDKQFQSFRESVRIMCSDLDRTLRMQSDYLNLFQNRVNELRG